jgi:hypothetical protein
LQLTLGLAEFFGRADFVSTLVDEMKSGSSVWALVCPLTRTPRP